MADLPLTQTSNSGGRVRAPAKRAARAVLPFAWLPVALFVVAAVVIYGLDVQGARESPLLLATLNTLFSGAAGLAIAYLAARTYMATGSRAVLSMGAGALALGLASLLAGLLIGKPNNAITVYNTGVFVAGLGFALSALVALGRKPGQPSSRPNGRLATVFYLGVFVIMALVTGGALAGLTPAFFVPGQGATALRSVILGLAILGFLGASALFALLYRRSRSRFHLYCGAGLAAIGVGLLAVMFGGGTGTVLNWLGRSGQYLGAVYLFLAIVSAERGRGPWLLPLERALLESEERYQSLVDLSPEAILVRADGKYIFANPAATRLFGAASSEDVVGRSVDELTHPTDREAIASRTERILAGAVLAPQQIKILRLDGSPVEVEIKGGRIEFDGVPAIQVVMTDITQRKQAEDALLASEVKYRRLFEAAKDGILILNADSGTVLDANPFLEELLGYSHAELLGAAIWDLGAFKDIVANKEKFEELQRNNYVRYEDLPLETSDGRLVSVEFVSNSYAANHQRVIQCNIRDISERKRAEASLRASEEQLRQSQKMEAVGQLAGGIAHDFNNLLTSILGYGELLLSDPEFAATAWHDDVVEIRAAGQRAAALTKQILAFSRRQALRPDVVLLSEVLNGMEPLLRRTLGENIDLVSLQHPGLGHAEIDVHQFEQVLLNLAINARDAMPSGGRLTLETANVELGEEYCFTHPEITPGGYVMLAVSDTGTGMDEVTLEHAFEPFFTTKAPGEGTGLGLAMVYGIVKQSRGNVFVYSEPGRGTTFKIYLPRVATRGAAEVVVLSERAPSLGSELVMVVEDESSLRSLIERVLGAAGYTVTCFGSADEALAALEQGQEGIDLLLTDVVLPGVMQGNDLARSVWTSRPDLPVIYMSGYTRNAIVHAGRLDEGVNFLEKPFTPEALARTVRQVLDQAGAAG